MDKFTPYAKMSKKQKRELDRQKRTTWSVNPVTRKPQNPKAYNRKKVRSGRYDFDSVPFLYISSEAVHTTVAKDNVA